MNNKISSRGRRNVDIVFFLFQLLNSLQFSHDVLTSWSNYDIYNDLHGLHFSKDFLLKSDLK